MIKKLAMSAMLVAAVGSAVMVSTGEAEARRGRGGAFAAGAAVGIIGGALLGGAMSRPAYAEEPDYEYERPAPVYVAPPPPRCYYERRRVPNRYDYGTHVESIRVCDRNRYYNDY